MEKDKYILFESLDAANQFLEGIKQALNTWETWDIPNEHPFEEKWVVSWNDQYLEKALHLLEGKTILTPNEVHLKGWDFHPLFKGSFANARSKVDQAQFLFDGLKDASKSPNFPVYRALFFSLLSSFYSIREALSKTCTKLGPEATTWWKEKREEIWQDKNARYFRELNNAEKHNLNPNPLKIDAMMYGIQTISPSYSFRGRIISSAEGTFGIANEGTAREKRIYMPGSSINRSTTLLSAQGEVMGDPVDLSLKVLKIYEDAVFEGRKKFSRN